MLELGVVIAVLVGVGQVVKKIGMPEKYIPLMNLGLGVVSGLTMIDGTVPEQVIVGAMIGLSASGLYDQSKIVTKK